MKIISSFLLIWLFVACQEEQMSQQEGVVSDQIQTWDTVLIPLPEGITTFEDHLVISAIVVSDDKSSNIYKSLYVVSPENNYNRAMVIKIDHYSLFEKFPLYCTIKIDLKGLSVKKEDGIITLGYYFNEHLIPISMVMADFNIKLVNTFQRTESELILNHLIENLKSPQNVNHLVQIKHVSFANSSIGRPFFDPLVNNFGNATNHQVLDQSGNSIVVRVSKYADFSDQYIQDKKFIIRGVLTKYNSTYQIYPRNIDDISVMLD